MLFPTPRREVRAEIGWSVVAAEVYTKLAGLELGAALERVPAVRRWVGTKRMVCFSLFNYDFVWSVDCVLSRSQSIALAVIFFQKFF